MGRPLPRPVRRRLRGDAGADPGPAEGDGSNPRRHRVAAAEPDRHPRDPHRPRWETLPGIGLNGASGEGGPTGSVNENKFANGVPDDLAENLTKLDELGGTKTYNHYPNGWAMAFNTPFKMWKRYSFNGGASDACIFSWPAGIEARGATRDQYHHAIDVVPTLLDCIGIELPDTVKGYTQCPCRV